MKIIIDIGHPAHVHYFRNFIKLIEARGHQCVLTVRDKEMAISLLDAYGIAYHRRGKGSNNAIGKLIYMMYADWILYRIARKVKPDLFLSFSSPYAAQVSKLLRVPHYAFDDTERAKISHMFYRPFTEKVFTPDFYIGDFGKKQHKFNGFMELCYLHPNYFTPDINILQELGVKSFEKYTIVRFVSWKANHDIGERGISYSDKIKLVSELLRFSKVFITSEGSLPAELENFRIKIPPEKIHHAMAFASLYIGESPTMTTESALLGVPAVCISSWACSCGNFTELRKYDLIYCYKPEHINESFMKAIELVSGDDIKIKWKEKTERLLKDKIDVTEFISKTVEEICIKKLSPNK